MKSRMLIALIQERRIHRTPRMAPAQHLHTDLFYRSQSPRIVYMTSALDLFARISDSEQLNRRNVVLREVLSKDRLHMYLMALAWTGDRSSASHIRYGNQHIPAFACRLSCCLSADFCKLIIAHPQDMANPMPPPLSQLCHPPADTFARSSDRHCMCQPS